MCQRVKLVTLELLVVLVKEVLLVTGGQLVLLEELEVPYLREPLGQKALVVIQALLATGLE
jgi:hypothetical protein